MNKQEQAVELLEKALCDEGDMIHYLEIHLYTGEIPKDVWGIRILLINLALALLKLCPICNDKIPDFCSNPKHFEPDEKLPAGDYHRVQHQIQIKSDLKKACALIDETQVKLDAAEAENKELKKGRPDKIDDLYISLGKAAKRIKELEAELIEVNRARNIEQGAWEEVKKYQDENKRLRDRIKELEAHHRQSS